MQIDWQTLALQTVNVLVLVWLMARFFFRPIATIVAQRQAAAQSILADAEKNRTEAAQLQADAAAERKRQAESQQAAIAEARSAAEREAAQIRAGANEAAAKLKSDGEASLARERAAAEQAIFAHAGALSVDIARRLLQVLSPEASATAFQDALATAIAALPSEDKGSLRTQGATLAAAQRLNESAQRELGDAIAKGAGGAVALTFVIDEGLIAGFELRGGSVVVRSNWAAALAAAREELSRDAAA